MKKLILLMVLSVSVALTVMAGVAPVSRSQLKQALTSQGGIARLSIPDARTTSISPQQLMRGGKFTGNDNRSHIEASSRKSDEDQWEETMIASFEAYDFDWDDENGVAVVNESSCVAMGKSFVIKHSSSGQLYLLDFYGSYQIPIDIDDGQVTLKAGVELDFISGGDGYPGTTRALGEDTTYLRWTLSIVPLQWLTGDSDDCEDIHGQVQEDDGSILFNDAFAFLMEKTVYRTGSHEVLETSWGVSPIFSGLVMLKPNGIHRYKKYQVFFDIQDEPSPVGHGHTGYMPRPVRPPRPGYVKPVSPRPLNAAIGSVNHSLQANTGDLIDTKYVVSSVERPVYMYMRDDTTLVVYNLYDLECFGCYENYMILGNDSIMRFPAQALTCTDNGRVQYSTNLTGTCTPDGITWGKTGLYYGPGSLVGGFGYYYSSNVLYFSDGASFWKSPVPTFAEPVVGDSVVEFSAETCAQDGVVELYIYDEARDSYDLVDNPFYVDRQDKPFMVYLAAVTYFEATDNCSEPAFLTYMVPAIETFTVGDVNRDKVIDVSDVTMLIGHVLENDLENTDTFCAEAADCNPDGGIDVSDVTALIGYVLTGSWPHVE